MKNKGLGMNLFLHIYLEINMILIAAGGEGTSGVFP
jgi:hypothetical protein